MSLQLSKKSILKKTLLVGFMTFASRILGIVREFFQVRYFGVGVMYDAFITAFRIPNFFRHVFAEGALSASFVPVIVKSVREWDLEEANGVMTLSFLFFEGIVLILYAVVLLKTEWIVALIAPGFSAEQMQATVPFLRILFSFLLVVSSSALLSGALNAVNHFFVPAFAQPLWNCIYILSLIICLAYALPPVYLCAGIVFGALVMFSLHLIMFFRFNFRLGRVDAAARAAFKTVLSRFLPCLFGVSIVELNMFVSGIIASFLPKGSISLLYLGQRFMDIPRGMFAVALSSVLLTHFSRLVLYAPRRLNFYLLEVAKLVTWAITPAMLFLFIVAKPLFVSLLGAKGTPEHIASGSIILILYTSGLLFLCMNKILLSMFYALKDTKAATIAAGICAAINIVGDLIGMKFFGVYGIGAANSIAGVVMTALCMIFLYKRHNLVFYGRAYLNFLWRYLLQLLLAVAMALLAFNVLQYYCLQLPFGSWFVSGAIGYWVITFGLAGLLMLFLFVTRRLFKVEVYFLH